MEHITTETIGRRLYEAYCASSGWKNYQGNPCPQWPDLTEAVRGHWSMVAFEAGLLMKNGHLGLMETK